MKPVGKYRYIDLTLGMEKVIGHILKYFIIASRYT